LQNAAHKIKEGKKILTNLQKFMEEKIHFKIVDDTVETHLLTAGTDRSMSPMGVFHGHHDRIADMPQTALDKLQSGSIEQVAFIFYSLKKLSEYIMQTFMSPFFCSGFDL
jgi:sortase (surface protein transpeptidase)